MGIRPRAAALIAIAAVSGATMSVTPAGGSSAWAPAATATIHPGVQTFIDSPDGGGQCTANFVFTAGEDVLIGQAAHCAATGAANETDGCEAGSLPLGTPVEIEGATQPGELVYSSWLTMQSIGESDAAACLNNDFALVRIDPADHARVNPSVPVFGGPVAADATTDAFEAVFSYGNSGLRLGTTALSPKEGYSLGEQDGGWTHPVYTVTPGIPGDSGSAFLDADGAALGVLSTLSAAPLPASNYVSDVGRAVQYMRTHGGPDATMALGTEPFTGGTLV